MNNGTKRRLGEVRGVGAVDEKFGLDCVKFLRSFIYFGKVVNVRELRREIRRVGVFIIL